VNRYDSLHQIDTTGSADHRPGSGRRSTAGTDENIKTVEQMNAPGTHGAAVR